MAGHAGAHHRNYFRIYLILLGLLVVSVVGPMFEIAILTLITAFGIAVVKAYLVAKNFMHLDIEKPIVHWMLALSVVLMVLMFAGLAPDVMKESGRRWEKTAGWHADEHTAGGHHGGADHAPGHGDGAHDAAPRGTTDHAAPAEGAADPQAPASGAGEKDHGSSGGH